MKWISWTDVDGDFFVRKFDDLTSIERIKDPDKGVQYYIYFNDEDEYLVDEKVFHNILELLKDETSNVDHYNYSF